MIWKVVFLCLSVAVGHINGQNPNATCEFAAPYNRFTAYIHDDFTPDQGPIECNVTGKIDLQNGSYICNGYFLLTKTGNSSLTLEVLDSFENFEQDVFDNKKMRKISKYIHIVEDRYNMYGTCDGNDSHSGTHVDLLMNYTIIDLNNHKPEFLVNASSYKVALPLMPGFDITANHSLQVIDKDLTTQNITIDIDNDAFEARYVARGNRTAIIITAKKIWNKKGDFVLKLTARDERGLVSDPFNVNVTIDEQGSLDVPSFDQVIYNFVDQAGNVDEQIKYQSIKPESVRVELIDATESFKAVNDAKNKVIHFTGKFPNTSNVTAVGLKIATDVSASCGIILTHTKI